jgi:Beta-galactosidase/beta-glucuronidase
MSIPRPEYPRPQFVRDSWVNLNGEWDFEIDFGMSGKERKLFEEDKNLNSKIIVPFCPESKLSGVQYIDFMNCVWYKKVINITGDKLADGKRTILHIGACDYETQVWVNGKSVGKHIGGYVAFSFDITDNLVVGDNTITICADDITRGNRPRGKQSHGYYSSGCDYTRTTGIWQTVWLETVPASYIAYTKYTTDIDKGMLYIEAECVNANGKTLEAEALFNGKCVGCDEVLVKGTIAKLAIKIEADELYLWSIEEPNLYDLKLTLCCDTVMSYFGMREIVYADYKMYINKKPVFQRLILDQGFYPDGIYTAPTDDELKADIQRSMDMGFNGARLHQKIFEPRFLYHCDKMGYIVWGEHASWGLNLSDLGAYQAFMPEWLEALRRDVNHPAIVGWCPLNETYKEQNQYLLRYIYDFTKNFDNTRPVIDTSGYVHVITDVVDCHDYDQNPETFKARYDETAPELSFVSEYGGIWWQPANPEKGWGYGNRPGSEEEFIARYKGLTEALLFNPKMSAFCYTQLTDIEQEVNGLYYYDRRPKFDPKVIHAVTSQKAVIEE